MKKSATRASSAKKRTGFMLLRQCQSPDVSISAMAKVYHAKILAATSRLRQDQVPAALDDALLEQNRCRFVHRAAIIGYQTLDFR